MVGFKTFWIAISALFLLGACVPQTKQSSCGTNEAFNSQLRTCVPIVGGAESFVTVKDFVPASVISKSQSDYTDTTLSITVANPYNQTYTVQWERIFNGSSVPMTPVSGSQGLAVTINPGQIVAWYNQIGTHIVTAKIFVGTKQVDSHNFTVQINQNPKPTIIAPVLPDPGAGVTFTPADSAQTFSFTVRNNIGLDVTHNWSTRWTVVKNNSTYATEVDAFTNHGAADSNFPSLTFNPSTAGIGNYTVRAIVSNNPPSPYVQEVVDERLWIVTVKHPDIGTVTNAHTPLVATQTVAFHGVSYDVWGFRTGVAASTTKGQYCVRVNKPEGAYIDGSAQDPLSQGIVVKFYKDGGSSPIFQGYTSSSPLKDTVCFSEASAAEQANLFFNDGSSTVAYYKTLKARVFDDQTQLELCVDGSTCPVTYPISWNIQVRPTNTPTTARILPSAGAGDLIAYSPVPTGTTSSANATVVQDSTFTVRFSLAEIAGEYDTSDPLNADKFKYTAVLKQGTTLLSHTCIKDFVDVIVGPNYSCTFNIPSSDLAGPISPATHSLTIQAEDLNSPVPGSTGTVANLLTWTLNVTEAQTAPSVSLTNFLVSGAPAPTPSEGQTVTFQLAIDDLQKDRYNLTIYKCIDSSCLSGLSPFTGNSATVDFGNANYNNNRTISYYIPEDAIGNVPSGTLYFKAVVTDIPHTPLLGASTELIIPMTVNQTNHAPVINLANLTAPAVNNSTAYNVFSGYRFSISTTGAVTDASTPSSNEGNLAYQWWIKPAATSTWSAITGATAADGSLRWTPGPELTGDYHITFCVTDGSYLRPDVDPTIGGSICSSQYYLVKANSNLADLTSTSTGEVALHHVPAERLIYAAYSRAGEVVVEKFTYTTAGAVVSAGMAPVVIPGSSLTSTTIKNLSLTASGNSLYVAYLADESGAPGSFRARVRRINITAGSEGAKTAYPLSNRKFGFDYNGIVVTPTCAGANCAYNSTNKTIIFNGDILNATHSIQIGSVTIPVTPGATYTPGNICGGCTHIQQAQSLVDAINSSSAPGLQGISASVSTATVQLHGLEVTNAWDSPGVMLSAGKIVYNGSRWYLPVVASGLSGADQNKIQILNAADGLISAVDITKVLTNLEPASYVDNGLTASNTILLGYVTLSGSVAKIIELDTTPAAVTAPVTLFSGTPIASIKVRPSPGVSNPNVFVTAKSAANVHYVARLPASLGSITSQQTIASIPDASDANNAVILGGGITDVEVQPALPSNGATTTNEAQLYVISNSGTSDYNSYLFRWKRVSSVESLDASQGEYLEKSSEMIHANSKIIATPAASITVGDSGSTVTDKTNVATFVLRVKSDSKPELGLLNTEVETIHSTTRSSTGLFRPALVR